MPIKKESISKLKDAINLIELIGESVELKKQGNVYKGACPFHDEKTPSFMVEPDHFHCFGCKAHGDAIAFLQKKEGRNFQEVAESLALKYGVRLEYTEEAQKKPPFLEALRHAERVYQFYLLESGEGGGCLKFLEDRGFDSSDLRAFGIGLVPPAEFFWKVYNEKYRGIKPKDIGISVKSFEGRISFPIRDAMGRTIGFSCRKWGRMEGEKYLNSPETELFKKRSILYGLDKARARIVKEKAVILAEGQTDVMRLTKEGLSLGVAPLGTSFTAEQANALKRIGAEKVYIAFDGDRAGREATVKAGDVLQSAGLEPFIVSLDDGEDCDSFILKRGIEEFQGGLGEASEYVSFLAEHHLKALGDSPNGKAKACENCLKIIERWPNPIVVRESKRRLADALKIEEKDVYNLTKGKTAVEDAGLKDALGAEKRALCAVLSSWGNPVLLNALREDDFLNPVCIRVLNLLKANSEIKSEELSSLFASSGLQEVYLSLLNFSPLEAVRDFKSVKEGLVRDTTLGMIESLRKAFKMGLKRGEDVSKISEEIKRLEKKLNC